jgi:hypothetical protein
MLLFANDESFYIKSHGTSTRLRKAANFGRSLRKSLDLKIKKSKKASSVKNTSKILRKKHLYTEAEMASETKLKLREIWVNTQSFSDCMLQIFITGGTVVVTSEENKDDAQRFRTLRRSDNTVKNFGYCN